MIQHTEPHLLSAHLSLSVWRYAARPSPGKLVPFSVFLFPFLRGRPPARQPTRLQHTQSGTLPLNPTRRIIIRAESQPGLSNDREFFSGRGCELLQAVDHVARGRRGAPGVTSPIRKNGQGDGLFLSTRATFLSNPLATQPRALMPDPPAIRHLSSLTPRPYPPSHGPDPLC